MSRKSYRVAATAAAAVAVTAAFGAAGGTVAAAAASSTATGVVFAQNDAIGGNTVFAFDRAADGTLTQAGSYATGGLGGSLNGAVVDRTASQGALAIDADREHLYAVNAGSNTVSVFAIDGDRLHLDQVVDSRGTFPASIAVHDNRVEVLNARDGGSVTGFRIGDGRLHPIPGSTRPLGLNAAATPEFVNTPGQVAFTPDGSKVL